jgi:cytochrome c peroxidase
MKRASLVLAPILVLGVGAAGWWSVRPKGDAPPSRPPAPAEGFTAEELERIFQHSPLGNPPADPTNAAFENPKAARLGQRIFYDPRFSRDGSVSCATCHRASAGFGDAAPLPKDFPVERNVPTLWNVAFNRWFFWDGRADSLWAQALKPLENPREHAGTRLQYVHLLRRDPVLKSAYEEVFGPMPELGDPARFPAAGGPFALPEGSPLRSAWAAMQEEDRAAVNRVFANLGKSIAAYERNLVTRRSPFDVFVEGLRSGDPAKLAALSPEARLGLKLFVGRANCRLCHTGPNFSDGEFHNIGIPPSLGGLTPDRFAAIDEVRRDEFNTRGPYSDDRPLGEKKLDYLVKLQDAWGQIKTPGLRNVARTAPYMHQGQFKTLPEVVRFYSTLQGMVQAGHHERAILTPLGLTAHESTALVAFLESLTDEKIDEALLKPLP